MHLSGATILNLFGPKRGAPVVAGTRTLVALSIGLLLVGVGCGDSSTTVDDNRPPDLSGTYQLSSFSSPLTAGETLVPPAVAGRLTLAQTSVGGAQATGTMTLEIAVPDGTGGISNIMDTGTYVVRLDGTWEQNGQLVQGTGTFTLEGAILTVVVTQPAISVSTTVWQRQ